MSRLSRIGLVAAALIAAAGFSSPAWSADLTTRTEALERQIEELRKELIAIKSDQARQDKETARKIEESLAQSQNMVDGLRNTTLTLFERVKVGGYGSGRYEANSLREQNNTFTLRRLVLTTDAKIAPRLRFYRKSSTNVFANLNSNAKPSNAPRAVLKSSRLLRAPRTRNSQLSRRGSSTTS